MSKRETVFSVQNSVFRIWMLVILIVGSAGSPVWALETGAMRVGVLEKSRRLVVPLPPLATITWNDESGATWQQTGTLSGPLAIARGDLKQALRAGGWKPEKTILLGKTGRTSELMIWTSRGHRILVMIWEKEAGLSGFSWGEER